MKLVVILPGTAAIDSGDSAGTEISMFSVSEFSDSETSAS